MRQSPLHHSLLNEIEKDWVLDNNYGIQKAETLTETDMLLLKGFSLHSTTIKACSFFFFYECSRIHDA